MGKAMHLEALTFVLTQYVTTSKDIDEAQLRSAYANSLRQRHPGISSVEISTTVAMLKREEIADRLMRDVANKMADLGFR